MSLSTLTEIFLPISLVLMMIGMGSSLSVTIVPVVTGMMIRLWAPVTAGRIDYVARKLSFPFLCFIMAVVIGNQWTFFIQHFFDTALPLTLFITVMVLIAVILGRVFDLQHRDRKTIVVEVSLQNTTMALLVALTFLQQDNLAIVPGCYGIMMFVVLIPTLWFYKQAYVRAHAGQDG